MLKIEAYLDRNFSTDSKIDEHLEKEVQALEALQQYLPNQKRLSKLNVSTIAYLLKEAGATELYQEEIGYSRYVEGKLNGTRITFYEEWGLNDHGFELEIG